MSSGSSAIVRCAAWANSVGLDPIGTAGSYNGFLLVELPLPWPRDITSASPLQTLDGLLDGRGLRVQALVPAGGPLRAVLYLNRRTRSFGGFSRREVEYGTDLRGAFETLISGRDYDGHDGRRDLLICTHGRRDVCCGSLGSQLTAQVTAAGALPNEVRLWRTSHTGGHRFAPTFIVLPEATAWAYADGELIDRVLRRRGDVTEVTDRYRGCAGLGSPAGQALEREVLRRVGWDLLDRPRRGITSANGRTCLIVETPDGRTEEWEGAVEPGRRMPIPDCGRAIEEADRFEPEWSVRRVRRI